VTNNAALTQTLTTLAELAATGRYVPYAGIGSRETPLEVQALMTGLATWLEQRGFTLRSGGAEGADNAFARGVAQASARELYSPWHGFGQPQYEAESVVVTDLPNFTAIQAVAERHHPNWPACRAGARKLHSRNVLQVLGKTLTSPSLAVLCWTRDGKHSGGTGQALRIADTHGVPVFNLHNPEWLRQAQALVQQ
jgi:hypothetical protein